MEKRIFKILDPDMCGELVRRRLSKAFSFTMLEGVTSYASIHLFENTKKERLLYAFNFESIPEIRKRLTNTLISSMGGSQESIRTEIRHTRITIHKKNKLKRFN